MRSATFMDCGRPRHKAKVNIWGCAGAWPLFFVYCGEVAEGKLYNVPKTHFAIVGPKNSCELVITNSLDFFPGIGAIQSGVTRVKLPKNLLGDTTAWIYTFHPILGLYV